MKDLSIVTSTESMTSRDIARLTNTMHKHVLKKIEGIIGKIDNNDFNRTNFRPTSFVDTQGRTQREITMTKSGSLFIASRYNVNLHLAVQLRWEELEKKNGVPKTRLEWIKLALEQEEKVLALNNEVENLSTALDSLVEWVSIIKVAQFNKVKENNFDWRKLKAKSKDLGFGIKKAESPRFGYQNLYHVNAFKACYPQYKYDFLD